MFPKPGPGPTLPSFQTLLVNGRYHPSAPIHLCLSHIRRELEANSNAILIAPDRRTLTATLADYNDDWLALNAGTGNVSSMSAQIRIFYPPSLAHLALLLATFRISTPSDGPSFNAKTHLDTVPSLLVILEPSFYFINDRPQQQQQPYTVSSYLSVISHALSTLSFLSSGQSSRPSFALFDSGLDKLQLPILRSSLISQNQGDDDSQSYRKESVLPYAQKYFECMATFDDVSSTAPDSGSWQRRRRLSWYTCTSRDALMTWEWLESLRLPQGSSEKQSTAFVWPQGAGIT